MYSILLPFSDIYGNNFFNHRVLNYFRKKYKNMISHCLSQLLSCLHTFIVCIMKRPLWISNREPFIAQIITSSTATYKILLILFWYHYNNLFSFCFFFCWSWPVIIFYAKWSPFDLRDCSVIAISAKNPYTNSYCKKYTVDSN